MSIPIKINPLGINSSIYISSPLIGKGTQSDPISLSFNPVYFRVDSNTNQFDINTMNLALKQDLNNYLPLSGGTINGYFNLKSDKILYNQYAGDASTYLNLSFLDANNVGIGRCEYVNENIRKCTRIATTNPNSSGEYIELSIGYDENGIARTWLNHPCNGNDGEVARCDWVKGKLALDLSTPLEADTTGNLWFKEFPDGFIIQGGTTLVTSAGTIATYLKPMSTCYGATAIIEGITDASKNVIIKTKNNISIELIQSDTEMLTVNWIVFGKG